MRGARGAKGALIRALLSLVVVLPGAWALASAPPAEAGPLVCGYVQYDTNGGPTSSVTVSTYCNDTCGGPFVDQAPVRLGTVVVGAFVCAPIG